MCESRGGRPGLPVLNKVFVDKAALKKEKEKKKKKKKEKNLDLHKRSRPRSLSDCK